MNTVWILVCDAAKARFFESHGAGTEWKLVSQASHDESRSKTADLVSGKAGHSSSEGGSAHHNAFAPSTSPKEVEKQHFAHTLGTTLDQGLRSGRFQGWVLVAPPHFVGLMDHELTTELKKHRLTTVDKELTHLSTRDLEERLRDAVAIPVDQQEVVRPSTKHHH